MSFNKKSFTDPTVAPGDATAGQMQDAEDSRDRIAEERKINPLFAIVSDMDQTGITTGS
jgi:hypothetical protein